MFIPHLGPGTSSPHTQLSHTVSPTSNDCLFLFSLFQSFLFVYVATPSVRQTRVPVLALLYPGGRGPFHHFHLPERSQGISRPSAEIILPVSEAIRPHLSRRRPDVSVVWGVPRTWIRESTSDPLCLSAGGRDTAPLTSRPSDMT